MTSPAPLTSFVAYCGSANAVHWQGRVVHDVNRFRRYLTDVVRPRITDEISDFDAELRGLATTGMETRFLEGLLSAVPGPETWELGEALAECVLGDSSDMQVNWPWNTVRDRRTPRASLPGADLVGFYSEDDTVLLLFGEVKTSSDSRTPPGVMSGGSGMTWQLEQSATRLDIQHVLLRWLHARCLAQPYRDLFQSAVKRYMASEGKELLLVGVLIRDTTPSDHDLDVRGKSLSTQFDGLTRIELFAWYVPVRIADWPALL